MRYLLISMTALLGIGVGCQPAQDQETTLSLQRADRIKRSYQGVSLLGDTLYAPELPSAQQAQHEAALQAAERRYEQAPDRLDLMIEWGRYLTQLSRYQEAIRVFTHGLEKFPASAELHHYRGYCYLVTRQLNQALQDFQRSAQRLERQPIDRESVGSDGTVVPLSTDSLPTSLPFEVYYHLGLAHYLTGQYGPAAEAYEACLTHCDTDDETVMAADWLYLTYRRLGEDEVAERTLGAIREDTQVEENEGYLERLLMYKGYVDPDSLLKTVSPTGSATDYRARRTTVRYGVGSYYLSEGDSLQGKKIFQEIVAGHHWAALDYLAAEADLARQRSPSTLPPAE